MNRTFLVTALLCAALFLGASAQENTPQNRIEIGASSAYSLVNQKLAGSPPDWGLSGNIYGKQGRHGYFTAGASYDRIFSTETSLGKSQLNAVAAMIGYRLHLGTQKRWFVNANVGPALALYSIDMNNPEANPRFGFIPAQGYQELKGRFTAATVNGTTGLGFTVPVGKKQLIIQQQVGGLLPTRGLKKYAPQQVLYTRLSIAIAFG